MLRTSGYRRYFSSLSENPLHGEAQDVNTYFPASTEMRVGVLKLFLVLLIWGLECFVFLFVVVSLSCKGIS